MFPSLNKSLDNKGQGLSLNTVVIAVIVMVVLLILIAVFVLGIGDLGPEVEGLYQECKDDVNTKPPDPLTRECARDYDKRSGPYKHPTTKKQIGACCFKS